MKKITSKLLEIREETPDTATFRMTREQLPFIAGQYCLVSIPDHPKFSQITRPFTFTSSPTNHEWMELTIKKMGEFTQAIFQLNVGNLLEIKGPRGEKLNFTEEMTENLVFLAGGSGITPFMSIIRYIIAKKLPNTITLFYGNRTEKDIIFAKELEQFASPSLRIVNILEQPPNNWTGETGRIGQKTIEKYISDCPTTTWFVCGPPPMTTAMKSLLKDKNIPESRWRIEPWELPGKL